MGDGSEYDLAGEARKALLVAIRKAAESGDATAARKLADAYGTLWKSRLVSVPDGIPLPAADTHSFSVPKGTAGEWVDRVLSGGEGPNRPEDWPDLWGRWGKSPDKAKLLGEIGNATEEPEEPEESEDT